MGERSEKIAGAELNLKQIAQQIIEFRDHRDWKQYHDPKNLASAISIEAAELLEIFLWDNAESSRLTASEKKQKIAEELADILNFSILFAHETGIDLEEAILKKLKKNAEKYPVSKAKGSSKKYDEID